MRKNHYLPRLIAVAVLLCATCAGKAFAQLNGTYSINVTGAATASNYTSLNAAITDLTSGARGDGGPANGPGVSGPVVLRLAAGTGPYTEQISVGSIAGASATNTIRITGGPSRETITFAALTTSDRHVIRLSGAKHFILDSLTIINTGTTYGYGVWLTNSADSNIVRNSNIVVSNSSTSSNFCGITASGTTVTTNSDAGDYNLIQGNDVSGGYYGISFNGLSTTSYAQNNHIIDNYVHDFYYYGIRHYMQNNGMLVGNTVTARSSGTTAGFGMYVYYNDRYTVANNRIYGTGTYGIYLYYGNYQQGGTSTRATVVNNMIGGNFLTTGSPYGIYSTTNTVNTDFYHNTISITNGNGRCMYMLSGSGNDVRNNIFSYTNSTSGYAFYASTATYVSIMDHNLFWAPGSSNFVYIGSAFTPGTYVGGAGFNSNSINLSPDFTDATSDLHIGSGANAYDTGANVGITTDYDGDSRPLAPSLGYDIGADEFTPDTLNLTVASLVEPTDYICPDSNQVVRVVVTNKGINTVSNVGVTANLSGLVTTTLSGTMVGPLPLGASDTIMLGTVNTWSGGVLSFEVYSSLAGDQRPDDDTLSTSKSISITPAPPTSSGATVCESDSATLVASSTGTQFWYDAPVGGNLVATGDTFQTPSLSGNATYYVESRGTASSSLQTTFAGGNACGGGNMFDVTAISSITIDSFDLHLNGTAVSTVDIYYKAGSYAGFETTPGAWTLLGTTTVTSAGAGLPTRCVIGGLTIPGGQTYAVYIYNANVAYTTLGATYTSPEMSVSTGVGLCSLFGGTNNPRTWNGNIYYTSEGCASGRTPVTALVNANPTVSLPDTSACDQVTLDAGAGSGFQYSWSTGDSTQVITVNSSATYFVTVTNQGCTATDSSVVGVTATPVVNLGPDLTLCDGATATLDAGNAGAVFSWSSGGTSQTELVSSAGQYSVTVTNGSCVGTDDITVVTGTTPASGFSFSVTGLATTFTNTSTGNPASYAWDFGDGATTSLLNPTHTYAAPGTYTVTLITTNDCGSDTLSQTITLVGMEEGLQASAMQILPNPTTGQAVMVLISSYELNAELRVTDMQGKVSLQRVEALRAGENRVAIDLSSLSKGMYFVTLHAQDQVWSGKVVRE